MAKIPGDMGKARSPSAKVRDRAETLAEVMERVKSMGMDEDTRKIISDMLGTVRPSAPPRSGRPSFSEREREARLREERARSEAILREERRKRETERAAAWAEEMRLSKERMEREEREHAEAMRLRDQLDELRQGAELGQDGLEVGNVVAAVAQWRGEEGQ